MPSKGLVSVLLLAGLLVPAPFLVLANDDFQDTFLAQEPVPEESIPGPDTLPENPAPPITNSEQNLQEELIEVVDSPEDEVSLMTTDEESLTEEVPELVWGCEVSMDGDGNEYEQCGMGHYRTLCGYNAGVEECLTFFEFYEEEPDYFQEELGELFEFDTLDLLLSWRGSSLSPDGHISAGSGQLSWTFVPSKYESLAPSLQHMWGPEFTNWMLPQATYWLHVYKGAAGNAELVFSEEIGTEPAGSRNVSFTEAGEYQIFISLVTLGEPFNVCAFVTAPGGELCPEINPRIEPVTWFMHHGRICNTAEIEQPEFCYDREHPESRPEGEYPLAFGYQKVIVDEASAVSSVLFLPGIKGSRLYRPSDTCDSDLSLSCPGVKLWEPTSDLLLRDLFLTNAGSSGRKDVYAKQEDIVAEVLGTNFYASFVNQMNALRSDGTIHDWKAVAYDWRLSLDDIISSGTVRGDKIFYREATDTPYIEESLRELAASSPTGKVSIVAHSNGGLVAKRLLQRLETLGDEALVDKLILVGVPQSGAPQAIGALLFGYGEALPKDECSQLRSFGWLCSLFGSRDVARELAEHAPMAYHLLPSDKYFEQVQDSQHPIALFAASNTYLEERQRYGTSIDTAAELSDFLAAKDGGREKPIASDVTKPNVLSEAFISYGREAHASLDAWVPPDSIEVYQIAGWGVPTVSGIEFYEQRKLLGGYKEMYRPRFIEDGDGVVPAPSALMLAESDGVRNFWVDLDEATSVTGIDKDHGNILELDEVRVLIRNILMNGFWESIEFISDNRPDPGRGERLVFYLHSPLSLEIYDSEGNHLGENSENGIDEEIDGATYGEFGEVKYIIAPAGEYTVSMRGKSSGTFSLDIQSYSENEIESSLTIADVPTTASTIATITVTPNLENLGPLKLDLDGDGLVEAEIDTELDATTLYNSTDGAMDYTNSSSHKRSSSSSTVAKQITHLNSTPLLNPQINLVDAQLSEVLVKGYEQARTPMEAQASESTTIEKDLGRSLTASAYDAIGSNLNKWFTNLLYNFWTAILKIFSWL